MLLIQFRNDERADVSLTCEPWFSRYLIGSHLL
jgi:hypothetical protein